MKLSIIIPVFNSEKYLGKCLESVFDQDLQASDFEVIVINDGSTDESEQVILQFAARYQNLLYLKQTNRGVSVARNVGLDVAKGEYITFVDSDDEIYPNSYLQVIRKLDTDKLDIFYPLIETFTNKGYKKSEMNMREESLPQIGLLHERRTFPATFYRAACIGDTRFPTGVNFGEDTVFNAKVQAFANRVLYSPIQYYKYFDRFNSLTKQGKSPSSFQNLISAIASIRNFQKDNFKDGEANGYFNEVYKIFGNIIVGEFLRTTYDPATYQILVKFLKKENIIFILTLLADRYPYIDKSYRIYFVYAKYTTIRDMFVHVIGRCKKKIFQ